MSKDEQERLFLRNAMIVFGKLQSALASVETMQESNVKREFKTRISNFVSWLEPICEKTTDLIDHDGQVVFAEFLEKLDNVSNEFKLTINEFLTID